MGVLSDACLGIPKYSKLEEKKNGLDVYKPVDDSAIYSEHYEIISFFCPICNQVVREQEMTSSFKKMRDKGGERIKVLIKKYIELIINYEEADIFDSLEKIYLEVEDIKNNYDENKYFYHICYLKNKNCYIIFFEEPKSVIEKWAIPPINA